MHYLLSLPRNRRRTKLRTHLLYLVCSRCIKHIPRDQMPKHHTECELPICPLCSAPLPAGRIPRHKRFCAANIFRAQLRSTTSGQNTEQVRTLQIPASPLRAWGSATKESPSRLSGGNGGINSFPRTVSIYRVEKYWTNRRFTIVIADFEFNSRLLNVLEHHAIFEMGGFQRTR